MPSLGGGLHTNSKTGLSVDFTTLCGPARLGRPCVYCYVAVARANHCNAKEVIDHVPYNGFVRDFSPGRIASLNALGGLRLFSHADYLPELEDDVSRFLDDCTSMGLWAKAITKVEDFVKRFHAYQALRVIHVSVDNLKGSRTGRSPITHSWARRLRERYAKLLVRAVVLNYVDLDYFGACPWVDILTLNHVIVPKHVQRGHDFHLFTNKERQDIGKVFPGRVCGVNHRCARCSLRCGVQLDGTVLH